MKDLSIHDNIYKNISQMETIKKFAPTQEFHTN